MGNSPKTLSKKESHNLLQGESQAIRDILDSGQLKALLQESTGEEDKSQFDKFATFDSFSSSPLAPSFNSLLTPDSQLFSTAGILIRGSIQERTSLISQWVSLFSQTNRERPVPTFLTYFLQTLFTWSRICDRLLRVASPVQETANSHKLRSVWAYTQEDGRAVTDCFLERAGVGVTDATLPTEKCVRAILESNPLLESAISIFGILFFLSSLPQPDLLQLLGHTQETSHPTYDLSCPLLPSVIPKHQVSQSILGPSSMSLLASHIPPGLRGPARQLFYSRRDGESFAKLTECVLKKGPTLIVVRDCDGYVFGGFASQSWELNPTFRGDGDCFLFTVLPRLEVFNKPTYYNKHFMYYQLNAETLPNGLGMGGQLEYFGLWLSSDFGKGHSKAKPKCTTYASGQLSRHEEFTVHSLEVWGFGQGLGVKSPHMKSALDQDPEAIAILEMAGKTLHSQGLREPESSDEDK